ncbi:peptidoglycan-binding protein [Thioploca ingrica]|uniref:Peptidoglycan-binding protein n=1 Tax=Thioploca ingrica TaxID=40754 RepID=A0A090AQG4_9GAMM|nr:peptidoglycan-binding protein [Thioploca ingrica]
MIFLETQGPYTGKDAWRKNEAWQYDPMQVANQGDFALDTIRTGKENTDLLSTQTLPNRLAGVKHTSFKNGSPNYSDYGRRKETEKMTPELSIETGVIWLFRKAISKVDVVSVPKGEQIFSYTVKKGDNGYSKIINNIKTTVTELEIQNGKNKVIHENDVLKYREASIERRISSWKSWSQTIQAYNSKDGYYERVNTYYQKLTKGAPCFGVKK